MKANFFFCAVFVIFSGLSGGAAYAGDEYVSLEYRYDSDFLDGFGSGGELLDPDMFLKESDTGGYTSRGIVFSGRKRITGHFSLCLSYIMNNTEMDPGNGLFSGLLSGTGNVLHNVFEYNINNSSMFSFIFMIKDRSYDTAGAYEGFDEGISGLKYRINIAEDFPVELGVYFRKKMFDKTGSYQGESYYLNAGKKITGKLKIEGMAGLSGRDGVSKSSARIKLRYDFN